MSGPGRAGAPLISVVLPVGGVARYLPGCLDSILGQPDPPGGAEVIAVDDASADGCAAILAVRAAADPRLRVVRLARRAGPGPARQRGLAEASGEYVWFVDPDDLAAAGSLAAIAERVAATRPDLLLIDYLTLAPSGETEPSPGSELLAGGPATVTLAARPELINRTMTVWSKVFRRPFLTGLRVAFAPGIHEDVPVSGAALLAAGRIALLGRACYLYRRRPGSFLATPGPDHFAIFGSYERLFRFAGTRELAPAVRAALFGRAVEHYSTILASGLVPRGMRREYFQRMTADYHRYCPPGYRRPGGLRGLKVALIGRGWYRAYAVASSLNAARVAARRAARGRRERPAPALSGRA
jgi:CDP-glycerol glycerophosphotransferase